MTCLTVCYRVKNKRQKIEKRENEDEDEEEEEKKTHTNNCNHFNSCSDADAEASRVTELKPGSVFKYHLPPNHQTSAVVIQVYESVTKFAFE